MTTILIKKKDTAGAPAAGDLTNAAGGAEIAVNTATKRIYTKDSGGNVVEVGTNPTATTMNGNLTFVPDNTYDIGASGATRPRTGYFGTSLIVPLIDATNVEATNIKALDGTAAMSIANSTGVVSLTANPILSGGTANGVLYLNGSKVATSGSAFTYDGTTLKNAPTSSGVTPSANAYGLFLDSSGNGGLTIATGASALGSIYFADTGDQSEGYIQYAHTGRTMAFGTAGSQQMLLNSTGLGIGTGSQSTKLAVLNANGTYGVVYQPIIQIGNSSSGGSLTATGLGAIVWSTDGLGTPVVSIEAVRESPGSGAASALYFRTGSSGGGTERMRILSGGFVGIGTGGPAYQLTVNGSTGIGVGTNNNTGMSLTFSGAIGGDSISEAARISATYTAYGTNSAGSLLFTTNSGSGLSEKARITAAGQLGVGTSTPNAILDVRGDVGTSPSAVMRIRGTNTTARLTRLQFEDYAGTISDGLIDFSIPTAGSAASALFSLGISGPTITMNVSGYVGIGTTAPASKLEISGNGELLRLDGSNGQDRSIYLRNVGTGNTAKVFTDGTLALETNAATPITFRINSGEVARFTSAGDFCVGTTSSSSSLMRVAKGSQGRAFYVSQDAATNIETASIYQTVGGGNNNQPIGLVVAIEAQGTGDRIYTGQYWNGGTPQTKFYVQRDGTVANSTGTYGTISDIRAKQDITDASSQWEDVKKIRFRKFRLIDDVNKYAEKAIYMMGPIAQELEEAGMKGLVETPVDKDGNETDLHKTVKLSIMHMKGMKALQEAMERIEQLEARLAAANL
jgi:hypothetical protein